jgi:hypothetical protein
VLSLLSLPIYFFALFDGRTVDLKPTALKRIGLFVLLAILYLVSTVPVGLFLYSLKTDAGFDVFRPGGYHAYLQCLSTSFRLKDIAAHRNGLEDNGPE